MLSWAELWEGHLQLFSVVHWPCMRPQQAINYYDHFVFFCIGGRTHLEACWHQRLLALCGALALSTPSWWRVTEYDSWDASLPHSLDVIAQQPAGSRFLGNLFKLLQCYVSCYLAGLFSLWWTTRTRLHYVVDTYWIPWDTVMNVTPEVASWCSPWVEYRTFTSGSTSLRWPTLALGWRWNRLRPLVLPVLPASPWRFG